MAQRNMHHSALWRLPLVKASTAVTCTAFVYAEQRVAAQVQEVQRKARWASDAS